MVNRIFVERKPAYANEARALCAEIRDFLGIAEIENVRIINRYDIEGRAGGRAGKSVSPPCFPSRRSTTCWKVCRRPTARFSPPVSARPVRPARRFRFAVRAVRFRRRPSARPLGEGVSAGGRAVRRAGRGRQKHVINPRRQPRGFPLRSPTRWPPRRPRACGCGADRGLHHDGRRCARLACRFARAGDGRRRPLRFCRDYFRQERRDPTMTELRMIDTYWSDHCRHTTFSTVIDEVTAENDAVARAYDRYLKVRAELGRTKPVTLMDIATLAAKYLKRQGILKNLDESDEINACLKSTWRSTAEPSRGCCCSKTKRITTRPKSSRSAARHHRRPIPHPLSGRASTYIGRCASPAAATRCCRCPKRCAASCRSAKSPFRLRRGYSSYGNQIGLATGVVDELYHDGYVASIWNWARSSARAGGERRPPYARAGGRRRAHRRPYRPRRLRRRDRLVQIAQRLLHRGVRRGGAEGQRARGSASCKGCSATRAVRS